MLIVDWITDDWVEILVMKILTDLFYAFLKVNNAHFALFTALVIQGFDFLLFHIVSVS